MPISNKSHGKKSGHLYRIWFYGFVATPDLNFFPLTCYCYLLFKNNNIETKQQQKAQSL